MSNNRYLRYYTSLYGYNLPTPPPPLLCTYTPALSSVGWDRSIRYFVVPISHYLINTQSFFQPHQISPTFKMKYTLATIAALASVALAKPAFLNTEFDLTEGQPYTIKYSGCDDGCTIVLQNGPSDDLSDYKTLTTDATGDSFTFTPSELPSDTYNFKITDKAGEVNYSAQFPYKGSYAAPSVTKSATATAETTAAVSTKESTTLASVTKSAEETTTVAKPIIPTHAPSKNATTPAAHPTPSKTGSAGGETSVPSVPESGASRMTSSLALIAGAVMAMVYLN
ncbi:hypothetical protein FVER53590_00977 [Fusarium verticillioides]|nr:hypothetical protein FVER53590_00977 [Fusarium verticillioides]